MEKSRLSIAHSRPACRQTDRRQTSTKHIPLDRYGKEIAFIDADRQTDDRQTTDVNKTHTARSKSRIRALHADRQTDRRETDDIR